MSWPQYVCLALMLLGVVFNAVKWIRSDRSSGAVTAMLFVYLSWCALYAWVLHEGGFW